MQNGSISRPLAALTRAAENTEDHREQPKTRSQRGVSSRARLMEPCPKASIARAHLSLEACLHPLTGPCELQHGPAVPLARRNGRLLPGIKRPRENYAESSGPAGTVLAVGWAEKRTTLETADYDNDIVARQSFDDPGQYLTGAPTARIRT